MFCGHFKAGLPAKMWCFGVSLLYTLLLPVVDGHSLFTCEPIMVPRCLGMSYNMTFFPNLLEHYDQAIAATKMEPFFPLMNLQCSPEVSRFLCMAFVPECTEPKHIVLPCRAMCQTVHSDCKNLIDTFDIGWPPELECDRLEDCTAPKIPEKEQSTHTPAEKIQKDYGFWCPRHLKTFQVTGYKFLGVNHCAPPCPNMYFKKEDLDFGKSFIGIISIICLCATLFTFLTFLIDVKRFRYPERPIIFYSVCYSMVSLIYFIGFAMGNTIACNAAHEDFADEDTVVLGSQNKACTVIFMLLYFSTMAGTIWWVMLTITWYLAAGQKWSCEAIEQKSMWFHAVAWGIPGILTITLLAMNKVEGDNISGVCFVGLYDQNVSTYFVLLPLCLSVFVGLSLLLAGIISLNNVRQVIQHDERNQEKLKKFMIRIGVFSGTYLVPLGILLCCYVYELLSRSSWERTWVADHCQEYHIPCPYQPKSLSRPDLGLFLTKYVMTLIVGISAIFWVGSKKTCSEWANFFNRNQKQDPVAESRRVLQESCEYFMKHNSKPKHKKHHRSSSHKLKVLSKSMGTSTTAKANHGLSAMSITSHDFLDKETAVDLQNTRCQSPKEDQASESSILKARTDPQADVTTQTLLDHSEVPTPQTEQNNYSSMGKGNGMTGNMPKKIEGGLLIENHLSDPVPIPDSGSPPSAPSPTNVPAPLLANTERELGNSIQTA